MASDGAGVVSSAGGPIKQQVTKIHKVGNRTLIGASGSIGVIQRTVDVFSKHSRELSKGFTQELRDKIKDELVGVFKKAMDVHRAYHGNDEEAPMAEILVATIDSLGTYKIWHIAKDCNDEFLDGVGFACVGGGDTFAYTLLKNTYSKELDIRKGAVLSYKVIQDAIKIGAFGFGEPVDVWVLNSGKPTRLNSRQLRSVHEAYLKWGKIESDAIDRLRVRNFL